jgi:5-methylcytosine-specific restriction protein A
MVAERAGKRCELCGTVQYNLQFHHRRPRAMGGSRRPDTNQPANCVLVCPSCHLLIESSRRQALTRGWLVRQTKNPAEVPLFRHGRWVLLDDHGCVLPAQNEANPCT